MARPGQRYCWDCHAAKARSYRARLPKVEDGRRMVARDVALQKLKALPVPVSYRTRNRGRIQLAGPEDRKSANASAYVRVYLKRGLITRGQCECCDSWKTQPHHRDYSKPLDVTWLCRVHHLALYGKSFHIQQLREVVDRGPGDTEIRSCRPASSPKWPTTGT